jgi:hypothetical protein
MRICDHWYTDPPRLHFEPPRFYCERPRHSTASSRIFTIMRIRIQFLIQMRIRMQFLKIMQIDTDLDPQLCLQPCACFLGSVKSNNIVLQTGFPKGYLIFNRKKICNSPDKIDSPVSSSGSLQELLRMNVPPEVTNLQTEHD